MFQLEGKTALITGACGGIATAALARFKEAGATLIGVDRNAERLEELRASGLLDQGITGDLTTEACQESIISELGATIDILINNVGAGFSRTLEDTTREDFRFLWQLNFEVAAMLCRGIMPAMAERGAGKVINISTVLAEHPLPTVSAYVASKAALTAFTRSVALQFAPFNVQANVLAPGYITNPKNAAYFASAAGRDFCDRFMPTGVEGEADAVTGALLFLSSPLSDYMTGHVMVVDGGYSVW